LFYCFIFSFGRFSFQKIFQARAVRLYFYIFSLGARFKNFLKIIFSGFLLTMNAHADLMGGKEGGVWGE